MTVGFRSHGDRAAISSAGYNQRNTVILNYNRFSNETTFRFSPLWTALTSVTYGGVTETKGRNVELFQSSCNMDSSLLDSDLQTTAEGLAWTERPKKTMEISRGLNIMLKRFFILFLVITLISMLFQELLSTLCVNRTYITHVPPW